MERGQLLWILLLPLVTEQVPAGALVSLEPLSAVSATPQSVVPMGVSRAQILSAQFECYLKILRDPPYRGDGPYCNRTWDGWMCWEDTPPGNKAVQFCPQYFQDFDPLEKVTKVCNEDGQWFRHPESNRTWSNYTLCSAFTRAKLKMAYSKYYLAITGHCLSLVSLFISLCIFFYFKSLSCQRISLHKNLFLSFILDSIVTIICLSAVANNHEHETHNTAGCKVLQFLYLYTMGCNYFWMLCEGIYLHTLIIVAVFVEEQQMCWYYILGWGFPLIPAVIHAVARLLFFNDNCWISAATHLLYIIHGPICVALLVNLFFLLNIVRVLITKLKVTHQAESSTYMKAVRATLILVPLLGIQFVLLPWKPEWRLAEEIYEYIMHIFMHYQGLLVATIFCFCNGERGPASTALVSCPGHCSPSQRAEWRHWACSPWECLPALQSLSFRTASWTLQGPCQPLTGPHPALQPLSSCCCL
ncbi:calcitonin gene-related peptide type 1 receptor-like isoform X1 [Acipenser ruthenus]|uniref:calcitonin gene-related peptide type 1 receptor-like isoform X1 n=1 Tax=Acipenser ruthenus TaxID=7906 RepID=UPI0027403F35|nr:calcitonin gene-related peptide type 1 receptor-like isoform X1 [Acipenser ruthenus]XP_058867522.1 calcitonin gene-related peptide type 1 receptor-like isoform X1 [Acipenser ruthenus]XP_058867523.1 calcitonin gene-related peptide type 1 receptor-like isoform X1 [Acipenser ruthenus]XP_058869371.1 calcitonin gene-related peptide type 1 receptor-like isoform X1 [Acipenser ruthenus]XP_058869372.1 calcitonin gene-related peptide type 1 receptor-like isoform X1 [Acipenser ruthenus]XP_058869373.1 